MPLWASSRPNSIWRLAAERPLPKHIRLHPGDEKVRAPSPELLQSSMVNTLYQLWSQHAVLHLQ